MNMSRHGSRGSNEFSACKIGQDDIVIHTHTQDELLHATDSMVAQAQRSVRILSRDTDPEIYNRDAFTALLGRLISRHSRAARVRILIGDPRPATQVTHRLIELWHRFPSFIELRELRDEYAKNQEAFVIVDDIGIVRRPHHASPEAVVVFRSLTTARDRAAWFDEAFERGAPSSTLRRLSL